MIRIDFGTSVTIATTIASANGTFSTTFTTSPQSIGSTVITAQGLGSSQIATTVFVIKAEISSISPLSGIVGTEVIVKGTGFNPIEEIHISFGTHKTITTTMTAAGAFSVTFIVDTQAGGTTVVTVNSIGSYQEEKTIFVISANIISVLPTSGKVGSVVTVQGTGYAGQVRIDFSSSQTITTTTTSTNGTFCTTFIVDTQPEGSRTITASYGSVSYQMATDVSFAITPDIISVLPKTGRVGSVVTVQGSGYNYLGNVVIHFGTHETITTTQAGPNGTFCTTFIVSTQKGGTQVITSIGSYDTDTYYITGKLISLKPTKGFIGNTVTVEGVGFGEGETVQIDFGTHYTITIATPNLNGTFSVTFVVDTQKAQTRIITATGLLYAGQDTTSFWIHPTIISVNPTDGKVGTVVTVSGIGFGEEVVRIDFGTHLTITTTLANESGTFCTTFIVSTQPQLAVTEITGIGITTTEKATIGFVIRPDIIKLYPETDVVGAVVTVEGCGYGSNSLVAIDFGTHLTITTATSNINGTFSATFIVDTQVSCTKVITATGGVYGNYDTTEFCIKGIITGLQPTEGVVGTSVTVWGAGFADGEIVRIDFGTDLTITTATPNQNGTFSSIFTVSTQMAQTTVITATGISGNCATTIFQIRGRIISVLPEKGGVGTVVTVWGTGFGNEAIRVDFGTMNTITTTQANTFGTFCATFIVNTQLAGSTVITTSGLVSGERGTGVFCITPSILSINPTAGQPGKSIQVVGCGFSGVVAIHFGTKQSIATGISVQPDGSFDGNFTVNSQPAGTTVVTAENNTDVFATTSFYIKGVVTEVNPNKGVIGTDVTVKGSGFNDGEVVYVDFGIHLTITTATTDNDGNFTATFTVDTQPQGATVITARDSTEQATSLFEIGPGIILLSPYYGSAGQIVTVHGVGYGNAETVEIGFGTTSTITNTISSGIGTFSATFTVNDQFSGNIIITATGKTSGVYDTTSFSLTAIWISPTSGTGSVATIITISGTGFTPGAIIPSDSIKVGDGFADWARCVHSTITVNSEGTFSITVALPALPYGSHDIQIITEGPVSINNFIDRFVVTPAITLLPWGGTSVAGKTSTITGAGFTASSTVASILFGTKVPTAYLPAMPITISEQGTFTAVLTLPSFTNPSTMTVKATDSTGKTATTTYGVSGAPILLYPVLTPTSGQAGSTWFSFQIQYKDYQGDTPYSGYPRVLLYLSGVLKQELALSYWYGQISQGATYQGSTTISTAGAYTYKILAYDKWGVPATPVSGSGPQVTGVAAPQLTWTGEPNYTSDGIDPSSGATGGTFTFRVSYYDAGGFAPATNYPKVYIRINGQALGSYSMTLSSGTPVNGTYSYSATFATASTDYNYYFEAYNTNTVQAIGTPTNIPAGTFTVTGPNLAPTLEWTGATGYGTDGVNSDKGAPGTTFNFEVLYKDANNDQGSVTLELTHPTGATSTYQLVPQGTGYAAGVKFIGSVTLSDKGTYSHRFLATDIKGSSSTPLSYTGLPEVLEPPQLLWTGETNYETDGLYPEQGSIATTFVYRVLYKHTKPASDMKLYITSNGAAYDTISLGGTSSIVATYTYSRLFSQAGNYCYYFSAQDIDGAIAIGSPTASKSGPTVSAGGGNAPVLSWTDVEGYADGLEPYAGTVSTPFTFMVKYTDADNDPPTTGYPKVEIWKNSTQILGQFSMDQVDTEDTTYSNGKDYIVIMPMGATSIDYKYKFIAVDTQGRDATGEPLTFRNSPRITEAPILTWSGNTNFTDKGVNPPSGSTGNYRYEIKYISPVTSYAPYAGNPQIHIAIGGKEVIISEMTAYDGSTDYVNGKIYYKNINLTVAATYTYWFTAYNTQNVQGVGTTMTGPVVSGSNLVPTLSYQGTGPFNTDGVDPNNGTSNTVYAFRVKYTDQNNNPPQAVSLIIKKSTAIVHNAAMTKIVEGTLSEAAKGIVYEATCTLTEIGTDYSYTFYATDTSNGVATALSKERILPAAKWKESHRCCHTNIDTDIACFHLIAELARS